MLKALKGGKTHFLAFLSNKILSKAGFEPGAASRQRRGRPSAGTRCPGWSRPDPRTPDPGTKAKKLVLAS